MCLRPNKAGKVVEEKTVAPFSIRDLGPEDLIVKPVEEKPVDLPSKAESKISLNDFLNAKMGQIGQDDSSGDKSKIFVPPSKDEIKKRIYFNKSEASTIDTITSDVTAPKPEPKMRSYFSKPDVIVSIVDASLLIRLRLAC